MEDENLARRLESMSLFRPTPSVVRSAGSTLDRSLFSKTVPISAARISNIKNTSRLRTQLEKSKELLRASPPLLSIRPDPDQALAAQGGKCFLLTPEVKPKEPGTWSPILHEAVKAEELSIISYELKLDYDYWGYHDIMTAILPEDAQEEIPVGFSIVGHVAHLNLREDYLPYKNLIAEVLLDKNPTVLTVINKIDDVGTRSEFRTFEYEVLAGPHDMNVETKEGDCIFRFDYSKVYWNSRLQTEHKRLVEMFKPGEVICDVMAGVGPFAVPAGKKGVFVWANDLNPYSYAYLKDAIQRNKVEPFVRPFCEDGHEFIHHAADGLLSLSASGQNIVSIPKKRRRNASRPPSPTLITMPKTINHFVMNLPATAIEFLDSFSGLYQGHESLFEPHTDVRLPMMHVHCFSTKSEDNVKEGIDICQRISERLGHEIKPEDSGVVIHEVRDVAPKKRMFCASFRLPAEIAFRERKSS